MPNYTLHNELKTALWLLDLTISSYARNLKKPDGTIGVSHTAVIRVAQEHDEIAWIKDDIKKIIRRAKREFPGYYENRDSIAAI